MIGMRLGTRQDVGMDNLSPFIEGVVGGNYVFARSTPVLHFLNRTKMYWYLKYIAWLFKKKQLI